MRLVPPTECCTTGQDRIPVLIIWQGHALILRQVLTDWPQFCLEDPLDYVLELRRN